MADSRPSIDTPLLRAYLIRLSRSASSSCKCEQCRVIRSIEKHVGDKLDYLKGEIVALCDGR